MPTIVETIMVMAMESGAYTQLTGQFIDLRESIWMATWGLMCYEDVCMLTRKPSVIAWEDRATMLARQSTAP